MTLTTKELQQLEHLSEVYRIYHFAEFDKSAWPDRHKAVFTHVKSLGETTFGSYAVNPVLAEHEPWKAEVRSLAESLANKAGRCMNANEDTWRFACEPIVFARLTSEVICRICRKRIWRSEIEATRQDTSMLAESLDRRQKARIPCTCTINSHTLSGSGEAGLNPLFVQRQGETINHDPDLAKKLPRKKERPDAIFGLRQTSNIKSLLYSTAIMPSSSNSIIKVHQVLGPSNKGQPIRQTGDAMLFPFIVVEAKSGTSADNWHSIRMQSCFPIRTFLETQNRLHSATETRSKWTSGPLVWFFSNKGEDWQLSIAFLEHGRPEIEKMGTFDCNIVQVWRGSITTRDGALQLLLLVDYIFDWARDVYREDIIRELRILSYEDDDLPSVIHTDTDIVSTGHLDNNPHHNNIIDNNSIMHRLFHEQTLRPSQEHSTFYLSEASYQRLLSSFKFPELNARKNQITSAFPDTFKWIFRGSSNISSEVSQSLCEEESHEKARTPDSPGWISDDSSEEGSDISFPKNDIDICWDNFVDWLESGQSIYWICGKPASGKSTLMKYVLSNPKTGQALKKWQPDVTILSHFFWKPGSAMQNSMKGLFCSLLYQIFSGCQSPGDFVPNVNGLSEKCTPNDWDLAELRNFLLDYMHHSRRSYCIFIDALDEISPSDEMHSILHLVTDMQGEPLVKCCVSSRLDEVIQKHLKDPETLHIHDLTSNDIRRLAKDSLSNSITCATSSIDLDNLAKAIAERADGVFLWAVVILKSLERGILHEDSPSELERRLESLPVDLASLYKDMWLRTNEDHEIYRQSSSFFFNLALRLKGISRQLPCLKTNGISIFELATGSDKSLVNQMLITRNIPLDSTLDYACRRILTKVQLSCAGLLEVYETDMNRPFQILQNYSDHRLLVYTDMKLDFVHRTAYDFLIDTEDGRSIWQGFNVTADDLFTTIFHGCLIRCMIWCFDFEVPCFYRTINDLNGQGSRNSVEAFLVSLSFVREDLSSCVLRDMLSKFQKGVKDGYLSVETNALIEGFDKETIFIGLAGTYGFSEYVQEQLAERDPRDRNVVASFVLWETSDLYLGDFYFSSHLSIRHTGQCHLMRSLLENFSPPHLNNALSSDINLEMLIQAETNSPWVRFLIGTLSIQITHFLRHCNDFCLHFSEQSLQTMLLFIQKGHHRGGHVPLVLNYYPEETPPSVRRLPHQLGSHDGVNCLILEVNTSLLVNAIVARFHPETTVDPKFGQEGPPPLATVIMFALTTQSGLHYFTPGSHMDSQRLAGIVLPWLKGDFRQYDERYENTPVRDLKVHPVIEAVTEAIDEISSTAKLVEDPEQFLRIVGYLSGPLDLRSHAEPFRHWV